MRCTIEVEPDVFEEQDREPECGKDFCDQCGDCLWCYGGDPCWPDDGNHSWIIYYDDCREGFNAH